MKLWSVMLLILATLGCAGPRLGTDAFHAGEDIAIEWRALCQEGGCLTGAQDWSPGGLNEGTSLHKEAWQSFLDRPPTDTVPFLITRLDSTTETRMHVCPFQSALEGEMAVYALQHVLEANWIQCSTKNRIVMEAVEMHSKRRQDAIRKLLQDRTARAELKKYFLDLFARRKEQASHNSAFTASAQMASALTPYGVREGADVIRHCSSQERSNIRQICLRY